MRKECDTIRVERLEVHKERFEEMDNVLSIDYQERQRPVLNVTVDRPHEVGLSRRFNLPSFAVSRVAGQWIEVSMRTRNVGERITPEEVANYWRGRPGIHTVTYGSVGVTVKTDKAETDIHRLLNDSRLKCTYFWAIDKVELTFMRGGDYVLMKQSA